MPTSLSYNRDLTWHRGTVAQRVNMLLLLFSRVSTEYQHLSVLSELWRLLEEEEERAIPRI